MGLSQVGPPLLDQVSTGPLIRRAAERVAGAPTLLRRFTNKDVAVPGDAAMLTAHPLLAIMRGMDELRVA